MRIERDSLSTLFKVELYVGAIKICALLFNFKMSFTSILPLFKLMILALHNLSILSTPNT